MRKALAVIVIATVTFIGSVAAAQPVLPSNIVREQHLQLPAVVSIEYDYIHIQPASDGLPPPPPFTLVTATVVERRHVVAYMTGVRVEFGCQFVTGVGHAWGSSPLEIIEHTAWLRALEDADEQFDDLPVSSRHNYRPCEPVEHDQERDVSVGS